MALPENQSAIDDRLVAMRAAGFRFATPQDAEGMIVALVGVRVQHGFVDIVQIHGEDDAEATRVPSDESDVLSPCRVLWRASGRACEVLDDLLALAGGNENDARCVDAGHVRRDRSAQPHGLGAGPDAEDP